MKRDIITMFNRPVGLSVKAFVNFPNQLPCNLMEELVGPLRLSRHCMLERAYGPDQVMLTTSLSQSGEDHLSELEQLTQVARQLKSGDLRLDFSPARSSGFQSGAYGWSTPRLAAILEAIKDPREGGAAFQQRVFKLGDVGYSHISFGFEATRTEEANLMRCLLSVAAPTILAVVRKEGRVAWSPSNLLWTSFACPERLPSLRWFPTFADYREQFELIPRLIREVGDSPEAAYERSGGVWEKDLITKQKVGDPASEGTMWWEARIMTVRNTVEFRALPSLPPEQLVMVASWIDAWLSDALLAVGTRQFTDVYEALESRLIPAFRGHSMHRSGAAWQMEWLNF